MIKEFETIRHDIGMQYLAYDGLSVRDGEKKAREALVKEVAKERAESIKEVKEQIEDLKKSLTRMETANKEVESEIEKLTKKESDEFFKELNEYRIESKQLSGKVDTWDFSAAKKILKKK